MAINAFLPIVYVGKGNQSNSVSKWPFITFGDSWKEVFRNFSQRVKQDVQKKKKKATFSRNLKGAKFTHG